MKNIHVLVRIAINCIRMNQERKTVKLNSHKANLLRPSNNDIFYGENTASGLFKKVSVKEDK